MICLTAPTWQLRHLSSSSAISTDQMWKKIRMSILTQDATMELRDYVCETFGSGNTRRKGNEQKYALNSSNARRHSPVRTPEIWQMQSVVCVVTVHTFWCRSARLWLFTSRWNNPCVLSDFNATRSVVWFYWCPSKSSRHTVWVIFTISKYWSSSSCTSSETLHRLPRGSCR